MRTRAPRSPLARASISTLVALSIAVISHRAAAQPRPGTTAAPAHAPVPTLAGASPVDASTRDLLLSASWRLLSCVLAISIAVMLSRALPRLERFIVRLASVDPKGGATASIIDQTQRIETLTRVTLSIARAAIWVTTIIAVLGMVGISVGPLLAGVSIAGVAVGFGAQSIVKDFFSGFFILLEDQFDVGDTVTVGAVTGVVERMTLRMTVLRDATGTAYFIPNSAIATVANKTYGWARCTVDVQFSPAVKASAARAALDDAAARLDEQGSLGDKVQDKASCDGAVEFSPLGALTMRVGVRAHAIHGKDVKRALIECVAEALRAHGFIATDKGYEQLASARDPSSVITSGAHAVAP